MTTRKLVRHLVWLESFTAAVEAGSLEGAAEHLGVARSVVSEHLRALEDALAGGEPLLERGPGRRLQLTSRGERLYEGSQTPLHQLDLKRLRDLASTGSTLRLALNPTLSTALFAGIAKDAAAGDLKLAVSFAGPYELVRQLQSRQLDLALAFTPLPPHGGVETAVLLQLPFVVLAAPQSALVERQGGRRAVRVEDLQGEAFVDWLRNDPYGGANSARFAQHGVSVQEAARAESFLQLYELLRAYGACAIAPDLRPMQPFPPDLHVWRLREEAPQTVEIVALWPTGGPGAEAQRILAGLRRRLGASGGKSK
ncbi:LysR family transcriptional regulator [Aggregicoccus sp. 17bor-14]|uniref:LysR substrate-binding domain-containing protein n=1 Tax=Myxococcaceae TaxID=31 RepID=UPI00129D193F|nr:MULTISPECIES: LysR family transcriptional regulator [Myxococcaceae]MBF5043575.1 LysR family transcriptional regulator [Simulacricoccus sp. 17bor-14]MRI89334.1 LysR family transcriptional regulator [Aggregicoccus sp. 17bor-14]